MKSDQLKRVPQQRKQLASTCFVIIWEIKSGYFSMRIIANVIL